MDTLPTVGLLLFSIIILIFLSGWFSGTETALTHLTNLHLAEMRKRNVKNIKYILHLKRDMNRTLVTILIGNNVVNILLSAIVAIFANTLFQTIGVSIAIGITTFVLILFGEISPKSYAIRDSEKIAIRHSKILYYIIKIFNPLIVFFIYLTRIVLKYTGAKAPQKMGLVTEENIISLASLGHKEGLLKVIEKDIIHKVFVFGDKRSKDIMTPMGNVFHLNDKTSIEDAKKLVSKYGFTRIPIMNQFQKVIGILYSKDLLERKTGMAKTIAHRPMFFSENTHITTVFNEMKKKRVHMATIQDKKKKHVGIITLEDILEELVGEIDDEYHKIKNSYRH